MLYTGMQTTFFNNCLLPGAITVIYTTKKKLSAVN